MLYAKDTRMSETTTSAEPGDSSTKSGFLRLFDRQVGMIVFANVCDTLITYSCIILLIQLFYPLLNAELLRTLAQTVGDT